METLHAELQNTAMCWLWIRSLATNKWNSEKDWRIRKYPILMSYNLELIPEYDPVVANL